RSPPRPPSHPARALEVPVPPPPPFAQPRARAAIAVAVALLPPPSVVCPLPSGCRQCGFARRSFHPRPYRHIPPRALTPPPQAFSPRARYSPSTEREPPTRSRSASPPPSRPLSPNAECEPPTRPRSAQLPAPVTCPIHECKPPMRSRSAPLLPLRPSFAQHRTRAANAVTLGVASSVGPSFAQCRVQVANAASLGAASTRPCRLLSVCARRSFLPPRSPVAQSRLRAANAVALGAASFTSRSPSPERELPTWFRSAYPLRQSAHLQGANAFDICCANALASARARVFVLECANALAPPCACSPAPGFAIAPLLDPQHSMANTSAFNCVNAATSAAPMRLMFAAPTRLLRTAPSPPPRQTANAPATSLPTLPFLAAATHRTRWPVQLRYWRVQSKRKLARFMIRARCIRHPPPGAPVLDPTLPSVLDSGAPSCSFPPRRRA
ncbi:hypothetical protein PUNSTDRAFT_139747, partial [Punctularia strigosozonata HHB-11173 SS5]